MKHMSLTAFCCAALALYGTPAGLQASDNRHDHAHHDHAGHDHAHHDRGAVLLPVQSGSAPAYIAPQQADNAPQWERFTQLYGQWTVLLDRATGTPHQAFGEPIAISGFEQITADNVQAAADAFLRQHASVLRVDPATLRLVRATPVNGRWYVSYVQEHEGVEVLLSSIELRIFSNGRVMAFGVGYYPQIGVKMTPTLSYMQASSAAASGLEGVRPAPASAVAQQGEVYVLPVKRGAVVEHRLVYRVDLQGGPGERYVSYVDAHTGDVVWRYNRASHATTSIGVSGGIKRSTPLDTEEAAFFPYQYITIGGQQYTTDENGRVDADVQSSSAVTATLTGPYAVVRSVGQNSAAYSGTVEPGVPLDIQWNDDNSSRLERNMFYHVNRVRQLYTELDPQLTAMDIPIYVTLEYPNSGMGVNAYSNGDSIVFLSVADQSMLMADGPSVLYHEYGHSLNNLFYEAQGAAEGMVNAACHEGTADVVACLLLDDPRVGVGVFANDPEQVIRNIDNDLVWPDDAVGESHADGQILAAAFWDLRESLTREEALRLSHFARYGLPDDPDDGTAFSEWFVETLIADDDDGNLANGTPHAAKIIAAFNRHQIGTNLFIRRSFVHEPLTDTQTIDQPFAVEFELSGMSVLGSRPDSVSVVYSTDGFEQTVVIPAVEIASGRYRAEIPAQPRGTYVQYFIRAWEPLGQSYIELAGTSAAFKPYGFLVGYRLAVSDNFEQEQGWTVGATGDDATLGLWERATPQEIDFSGFGGPYVMPGDDHTPTGSRCFVNGAAGGFNFQQGLLSGTTTLTSPQYDLTTYKNPVVRLYRWVAMETLDGAPVDASLRVEMSADGTQWMPVETVLDPGQSWEKIIYRIPEAMHTSETFRMRFIAQSVRHPNSFIAPLFKVLIDDVDILTGNELSTSVEEGGTFAPAVVSYPNPFAATTTIGYAVAATGEVSVRVYSLLGEHVATLAEGRREAGDYRIEWNGQDRSGVEVAPGTYIVTVSQGGSEARHIVVRH